MPYAITRIPHTLTLVVLLKDDILVGKEARKFIRGKLHEAERLDDKRIRSARQAKHTITYDPSWEDTCFGLPEA